MKKWIQRTLLTFFLFIVALGWIIADAVTRPQNVHLKAQIRISKQAPNGTWEQIDEVGPAVLSFSASLADLTSVKKVNTDFTWRAKSKNGSDYLVRLSAPADITYNPVSGQLDGTFPFEITYNGKTVQVNGKSTTESLNSPLGIIQGKRAKGVFGVQPSEFTFISSNDFQVPGGAALKLVCLEEYRLTPGR